LAESLSAQLDLPCLCLDAIYHGAHWSETPLPEFCDEVNEFVSSNEEWVIDGNYERKLKHSTWTAATDIVWIDLPIYVVLWQLFWRTVWRIWSRVELWGKEGCVETFRKQFLSTDSLL
jgi:adenylate kinase family enzyme